MPGATTIYQFNALSGDSSLLPRPQHWLIATSASTHPGKDPCTGLNSLALLVSFPSALVYSSRNAKPDFLASS